MSKSLITLSRLSKQYQMGEVEVCALQDINLALVEQGDGASPEGMIALCGPSGSGKSTLLNIIGCLDRPTAGEVKVLGHDVLRLGDDELSDLRHRSLGFIFQTFNLIPVLSAFENIEYPLLLSGLSGRERRERVSALVEEVGLTRFATHRPSQLSGGQQQRVAIARALVTRPQLVLADEPTANLDTATGLLILELMQSMRAEHGCTFIFATHDSRLLPFADRIVRLVDGKLAPPEPGDPKYSANEVISNVETSATACAA
jgi:putative ABC transport system ATP-binding protein